MQVFENSLSSPENAKAGIAGHRAGGLSQTVQVRANLIPVLCSFEFWVWSGIPGTGGGAKAQARSGWCLKDGQIACSNQETSCAMSCFGIEGGSLENVIARCGCLGTYGNVLLLADVFNNNNNNNTSLPACAEDKVLSVG